MSEPTTAECRCGRKLDVPANAKVLCMGCGLAFSRSEANGANGNNGSSTPNGQPPFPVLAEDLRAISIGREAAKVRQAMRDGATPDPVTMTDEKAFERVMRRLAKEMRREMAGSGNPVREE